MGGWEGGRHGGGAYEPSLEVLIRLGSGGRCWCGQRVCQRPETPSCPPFILLSPSPAAGNPHSSDKTAGREEEEEGEKLKSQLRHAGLKPTTEALISVSPSLMCTRQNPFVSHLLPRFGPDSLR